MRKISLASAAAVVLLIAVVLSVSASQAAEPAVTKSTTLTFDVLFSPFTVIATNNERDPNSPISLGDETLFHDQLLSHGKRVGDDAGSCVILSAGPEYLSNCTLVFRLPGGTITGQFLTSQGPAPKPIALTGGTGIYRNAGGEGTLQEFGPTTGTVTLHVLALVARGGGS
jgi:hypothetical protein